MGEQAHYEVPLEHMGALVLRQESAIRIDVTGRTTYRTLSLNHPTQSGEAREKVPIQHRFHIQGAPTAHTMKKSSTVINGKGVKLTRR